MNWLDTQTKEILQPEHNAKLSPPKVAEFALVLVRKGMAHRRIVRAVSEINHGSEADATGLVNRPTPVTINSDLTEEEALWGQFELICCDSISVFVRSEVLEQSDKAYLQSLFQTVLQSIEFSPTTVRVLRVPRTEAGAKFIDQFLGGRFPKRASPVVLEVTFKKARMMQHWGTHVGAEIQVAAGRGAEPTDIGSLGGFASTRTDSIQTPTASRGKRYLAGSSLALFAVMTGVLAWLLSRPAENKSATAMVFPTSHPVFGMIRETTATDVMELPEIRGPTGLLPRGPVYLVVGSGLLEWSAADVRVPNPSGHLYFRYPLSTLRRSNVWAFAACQRTSLADLTEDDLKAVFCGADDNDAGRVAFGTNWVQQGRQGSALLVKESQIILARYSSSPSNIYALEMADQNRGYLRVRYLQMTR